MFGYDRRRGLSTLLWTAAVFAAMVLATLFLPPWVGFGAVAALVLLGGFAAAPWLTPIFAEAMWISWLLVEEAAGIRCPLGETCDPMPFTWLLFVGSGVVLAATSTGAGIRTVAHWRLKRRRNEPG